MQVSEQLEHIVAAQFEKTLDQCSDEEIYGALLQLTKERIRHCSHPQSQRKLYYISAEFLIGKLLSNNLINLGIYEDVKTCLSTIGKSLSDIEELELEPSLGNGGLGRLAACFMDSLATLGLNGDGIGLNYHFGLFHQLFKNLKQYETKDPWLKKPSWLEDTGISFPVEFGHSHVVSRLYDLDVVGYESGVNTLHLFDLDGVDESLVKEGIDFDENLVDRNLTLFLYPDDSTEAGRRLRVYQEYFMVSNAAQYILWEQKKLGHDLHHLDQYVCIQINDTHPSMIIPELIRRLMFEGVRLKEAIKIVSHTCAYTNHTILAEALETWPYDTLADIVPQLMPIIEVLHMEAPQKAGTEIIDANQMVHMASMDIHYGYSINGVAALHTEILKTSELKNFYELYPDKFNNKTNGITFRRWLLYTNPDLSAWIEKRIGPDFKKNADELTKLVAFDQAEDLAQLKAIKDANKQRLCAYIEKTQDIHMDPHSIFDIQIKRLHEYKRQQMNLLYIIWLIEQIRKGYRPNHKVTFIFGAKAAPAYILAKDIIHAILCVETIIEQDDLLKQYIQVVMVENYNVTKAEKLIPAADISEQISLASKEASGTGNMKLMLNGAVTLGTMDGANVEIANLVGKDNIYIFGQSSETVIAHYAHADYHPQDYIDEEVKTILDFLVSDEMVAIGDATCLQRLYQDLNHKDWFMALLDLKSYIATKNQMIKDYQDTESWMKKSLVNISKAGFFSSDRTIEQYNHDIWKLD